MCKYFSLVFVHKNTITYNVKQQFKVEANKLEIQNMKKYAGQRWLFLCNIQVIHYNIVKLDIN